MMNQEIARIFYEIAQYLEMQDTPFKPRAYEKAGEIIEGLSEQLTEIYQKGGLKALINMPGVGISIAEKIEEFIKTGRVKYYEELKKKIPVDLENLSKIEGLGPKSIHKLYKALDIKNLGDLEKSAKAGKIGKLEGFGQKSEENILKGIEFAKKSGGRFILGFVLPQAREIEARLKNLKETEKIVVAGSARRRKETIGDIDILVVAKKPKIIMDYFVSMKDVAKINAYGETKSAIKLDNGLNIDLRIVPRESYGAALNYFTGSKNHNIAIRAIAMKKGYKLNEYGLFQSAELHGKERGITQKEIVIAHANEEEIYKKLGLDYIEPEMRENIGEIELAKEHKLPKLIGYGDLKGDLQVQTNWTDGLNSIEEMAKTAMERGLTYIAITDHTKRLAMAHGLDDKRIQEQWKEIDAINRRFKIKGLRFKILKGTECDILKDGSLDLSDKILSKLDVVGVSVHSNFNLSKKDQTERIIKAINNPNVDILFHPTGRLINKREPYDVDMEAIIQMAKQTGAILEINGCPVRADLKDEYIKKCVEAGVKMVIDSDAHSITNFSYLEYGVAQARRGWAERKDIANAWDWEKTKKFLKSNRE